MNPPDDTANQGDPAWATDYLDSTASLANKTIGNKGCALTSLGMAINFALPDPLYTPASLNKSMAGTDQDFLHTLCTNPLANPPRFVCGADVNWQPATSDSSGHSLNFYYTRISSEINATAAADYLTKELCAQHPVIAGVKLYTNSQGKRIPGHFVLVTGQDGPDFKIIDPNGGISGDLISKYGAFETRGFVADPPGDISSLNFGIGDPGELSVTDPTGRITGLAPSGADIEAIPLSVYLRDTLDDDITGEPPTETGHIINIFQPNGGVYALTVTGLYPAISTISVRPFSSDGSPQSATEAPVILGTSSSATFLIQFENYPGSTTKVTRVSTFQDTLADIRNSLRLGLIDNPGIGEALSSKINAAYSAATRGDTAAEVNELNAFIAQVKAQAAKHITDVAPQVLVEDAESLLGVIH